MGSASIIFPITADILGHRDSRSLWRSSIWVGFRLKKNTGNSMSKWSMNLLRGESWRISRKRLSGEHWVWQFAQYIPFYEVSNCAVVKVKSYYQLNIGDWVSEYH